MFVLFVHPLFPLSLFDLFITLFPLVPFFIIRLGLQDASSTVVLGRTSRIPSWSTDRRPFITQATRLRRFFQQGYTASVDTIP